MIKSGGNSCGSEGIGESAAARPNKPRVPFAELAWVCAFNRLKALPRGTKLYARGIEFKLDGFLDDPHPPSLWLKYRENRKQHDYIVRRGDPLMIELKEVANVSTG